MCGIGGILNWSETPEDAEISGLIGRLTHRGPDGVHVASRGPLRLGHARLSILDTSSAGDQPMTSADGRFTIVHNGEIYNFLELRDELRKAGRSFHTETDTEVILESFAIWGPSCVERFNGIWAFALWDRDAQRLFLSRDRFGVKPLFLARQGNRLAFASEIKALLSLSWVGRDVHPGAVRDFLVDAKVDHAADTFFRAIHRLQPGHSLVVDIDGATDHTYWAPPALSHDASAQADAADGLRVAEVQDRVIDAVSLQLRTDVPIGSCLSGGLDSSTIVCVANALRTGDVRSKGNRHHERDGHPQRVFHAESTDPATSERRYVDAVVAETGVDLETVRLDSQAALASLDAVVHAQDEPFVSASVVAQYHVMRLARASGVTVLLDGQGADEVFAGYPPYRYQRDRLLILSRDGLKVVSEHWETGSRRALARLAWSVMAGGTSPPMVLRAARKLRRWLPPEVASAESLDVSDRAPEGTALAKRQWRDVHSALLPSLLRYEDRNSAAFGLEARVPFLDHRVVELGLALPDRLKIRGRQQKWALRQAFGELLPASVLGRRDKIAFAAPQEQWLDDWLPSLNRLADSPHAERLGILRIGTVHSVVDRWSKRQLESDLVWRVLGVELWVRKCVTGEPLALSDDVLVAPRG
jgi:asparagine synthase (glutamine-hydrolysing)